MRIPLPLGRGLFLLSALLFALVATLPMRLALSALDLDARGFAAREVRGSLWLGALSEAQWGPVRLGDLTARLGFWPLFLGRARMSLERDAAGEGADDFTGAITVSRNTLAIDDLTARLDLTGALGALPVGAVTFTDFSARFADGLCAGAEGLVKADVRADAIGLPMQVSLSGNARCDEAALLLPLAGPTGGESLNLRLFEDGRYTVELALRPLDPTLAQRLQAGGFAISGDRYVLATAGRF